MMRNAAHAIASPRKICAAVMDHASNAMLIQKSPAATSRSGF
jgi:hypothetical protein